MITLDAVGSISGLGLQLFRVRGSRALGFRPGLRRLERPIPAPCCSQASSLTLTAKNNSAYSRKPRKLTLPEVLDFMTVP